MPPPPPFVHPQAQPASLSSPLHPPFRATAPPTTSPKWYVYIGCLTYNKRDRRGAGPVTPTGQQPQLGCVNRENEQSNLGRYAWLSAGVGSREVRRKRWVSLWHRTAYAARLGPEPSCARMSPSRVSCLLSVFSLLAALQDICRCSVFSGQFVLVWRWQDPNGRGQRSLAS